MHKPVDHIPLPGHRWDSPEDGSSIETPSLPPWREGVRGGWQGRERGREEEREEGGGSNEEEEGRKRRRRREEEEEEREGEREGGR